LNSKPKYTSRDIALALEKLYPGQTKTIKVTMKYTKEVNAFIKAVEEAHARTAKSKQVFKTCNVCGTKHSPVCEPLMG
jgi:hypothetical protein